MNTVKAILGALLAAIAVVSSVAPARAAQVHRCDNCSYAQKHNAALTSTPLGQAYVFDLPNAELTTWEVRHDRELRMKTADQTETDPSVYNMFLNILGDRNAPRAENDKVLIQLDANQFTHSRFTTDPLAGLRDYDAYDFAASGTLRGQLGTALTNSMVGGPGHALWQSLVSILFSIGSPIPSGYIIVITWKDGSKTTMQVDAASVNQAQYVPGGSRNPDGVPIPDSAVNTDQAGGLFAGEWEFGSQQSLEDWVNAMAMNGVPITGPGGNRVACVRVDGTLTCYYL